MLAVATPAVATQAWQLALTFLPLLAGATTLRGAGAPVAAYFSCMPTIQPAVLVSGQRPASKLGAAAQARPVCDALSRTQHCHFLHHKPGIDQFLQSSACASVLPDAIVCLLSLLLHPILLRRHQRL